MIATYQLTFPDYIVAQVRAENGWGLGQWSNSFVSASGGCWAQVQTVPDPVTMGLTCPSVNSNSATITWKDGSDGGSPITEYTIYYNENGVSNTNQFIDNIYKYTLTSDNGGYYSYTINGLNSLAPSYQFYVIAHNDIGVSLAPTVQLICYQTLAAPNVDLLLFCGGSLSD